MFTARRQLDGSARCRVFFLAHPVDDTPPKQGPDDESLGVARVGRDELSQYPARADMTAIGSRTEE